MCALILLRRVVCRWLGYGDDALSSEQQAGPSRPLAWHTSKLQLAVGSGPRQVLVFRVERGAGGGAGPAAVDKPQRVLQGPQQQQVCTGAEMLLWVGGGYCRGGAAVGLACWQGTAQRAACKDACCSMHRSDTSCSACYDQPAGRQAAAPGGA